MTMEKQEKTTRKAKREFTFIDLFAGCGGLSEGLMAVEIGRSGRAVSTKPSRGRVTRPA